VKEGETRPYHILHEESLLDFATKSLQPENLEIYGEDNFSTAHTKF